MRSDPSGPDLQMRLGPFFCCLARRDAETKGRGMRLPLFLRLVPLLLLSDTGEAGADEATDGATDDTTDTGRTPETATDDRASSPPKAEPSANKLIKDFVKQQGISVEDLIAEYSTLKDANKTEFQRLESERDSFKSRAEQFEQQYRQANARVAFMDAAGTAGSQKPGWLYRAVKDDIEFDEDGNPTNIDEVIANAKAEAPHEFRAAGGSGDGGAGRGQSVSTTDMNSILRDMARSAT